MNSCYKKSLLISNKLHFMSYLSCVKRNWKKWRLKVNFPQPRLLKEPRKTLAFICEHKCKQTKQRHQKAEQNSLTDSHGNSVERQTHQERGVCVPDFRRQGSSLRTQLLSLSFQILILSTHLADIINGCKARRTGAKSHPNPPSVGGSYPTF